MARQLQMSSVRSFREEYEKTESMRRKFCLIYRMTRKRIILQHARLIAIALQALEDSKTTGRECVSAVYVDFEEGEQGDGVWVDSEYMNAVVLQWMETLAGDAGKEDIKEYDLVSTGIRVLQTFSRGESVAMVPSLCFHLLLHAVFLACQHLHATVVFFVFASDAQTVSHTRSSQAINQQDFTSGHQANIHRVVCSRSLEFIHQHNREHFCSNRVSCHLSAPVASDSLVRMVKCGQDYSAVLSDDGLLFTFGDNSSGKLGHARTEFDCSPSVTAEPFVLRAKVMEEEEAAMMDSARGETDGGVEEGREEQEGGKGRGTGGREAGKETDNNRRSKSCRYTTRRLSVSPAVSTTWLLSLK
eukprot:718385-Hanusia_phi.AAC.1